MPSYSPQDVQDELLKVIRTSQETVVEAVKTCAYDFAEKLLSGQRQFAEELVKATASLRPGSDAHEEQAAAAE